jgi:hypothetical protein
VDVADGVIDVGGSGVANVGHEDIVVRFMNSPKGCLANEVGKCWISVGHGDKMILSADAGTTDNKTILVESSLIVKVKIVSTRSVATFWSISYFQLQF